MDPNHPTATAYPVAVIMVCKALVANRWQTQQWEAAAVVDDTVPSASSERISNCDGHLMRIKFGGHQIRLYRDEAEGYLLNISSPQPKVFVLWRIQDELAQPQRVTVSYYEGARWMDSDESVDGVPLPPELLPWIHDFAIQHYTPEAKKAKRYASSKDRGRMGRQE